jgi:rhodanese-related sulfurtransferase
MGPFVPDLISDQLNLVVAFVIGIAFGIVLEQAGFSSSRRLTGLFYGYDFTVLRVFFTAAITAISGITLLEHFGFLDTGLVYVNTLYLLPAVVGGICMGVGFILGGYCPGTSMCALSIGKTDAMMYVGGGLLGVFLYAELTPLLGDFADSTNWGSIYVYDSLGLPKGLFTFLLIATAIGAFSVVTIIEKRVNKDAPSSTFPKFTHRGFGTAALAAALLFVWLPNRQDTVVDEVSDPAYQQKHPIQRISSDEVAFRILDRDPRLILVDFRSPEEYAITALPGSANMGIPDLFKKEADMLLAKKHNLKVFISSDGQDAQKAALAAHKLGYASVSVLEGGFDKFRSLILSEGSFRIVNARWDQDVQRFRTTARGKLLKMMEEAKAKPGATLKKVKKIKGGC